LKRRTKSLIAVAAVISCICLVVILFLWKTGAIDYLDCYQLLRDAYSSDSIDMDVSVSVDSSLIDANVDFNAVKIPYGNRTVTKFTLPTILGKVEIYQIGEKAFLSTGEHTTAPELPEDFTVFLKWCSELYHSGYTIMREKNGESIRYQVEVPDDEVAALMKSYGGKLGEMDIRYSGCTLIVTTEGGELQSIQLSGTASYTLLADRELRADMTVNADINALGEEVEVYPVPEALKSFD
jgi:hypothetical protein